MQPEPCVRRQGLPRAVRVAVPWLHSACGYCRFCAGGWETLCESQQNSGFSVDGGYAEYALLPNSLLMPLTTRLPWDVLAALPEPLASSSRSEHSGRQDDVARF